MIDEQLLYVEDNVVCYYVGSDTILANYLAKKAVSGVSSGEVVNYCAAVYRKMRDNIPGTYAYFDISIDSLINAVNHNDEYFELFLDKFFLKKEIDIDSFNKYIDKDVKDALLSVDI
jgi:hypothetical protein